eukprot:TRINITY_DN64876_c0_g1_i1.p1 TRINITY_DN64876_c0_g1~~TRINITY_DN64876_c0_g1_i1.p1  ORF type:complete len:443 (+),score=119.48 TRINITY_DN64876_c0_g1_i1:57-1385(+)
MNPLGHVGAGLARAGCKSRSRLIALRPSALLPRSRLAQSAAEEQMPENLRKIMADYDQRRAFEEANQPWQWRLLNSTAGGMLGAGFAGTMMYLFYCLDDVSSPLHDLWGVVFRSIGAQSAKNQLLRAARWRLLPKDFDKDDPYLVIEPQEGLKFFNPVGLAPGLDKEAVGLSAFFDIGFGFVDAGPVGGSKGCEGAEVWKNLQLRDPSREVTHLGLTGVLVGGDKDELLGHMSALGPKVQLFSVDLAAIPRELRSGDALVKLLRELNVASTEVPGGGPRVFVRLPAAWPDTSASPQARRLAVGDAAAAALAGRASGLVICHDDSASDYDCRGNEESRRFHRELIEEGFVRSKGELVIVASGGMRNGRDAMDAVEAGATVVQISSLLLSEGPRACRRIKDEMAQLLMQEGHVNLAAVVGLATLRKTGKSKQKIRNPWKPKAAQ